MTHLYLFLGWFDDFSLDAGHYKWFITDILDPLFLSKSNICSDGSLGWLGSNIKLYLPCCGQQLKWLLNSVSSCCISCLEILGRLLCMWGLMVNPGLRWLLPAGLSLWAPPFRHSPPNFLTVLHPQFLSSDTSRQWAGGSLRWSTTSSRPHHSEQLLKKQRLPPGKREMRASVLLLCTQGRRRATRLRPGNTPSVAPNTGHRRELAALPSRNRYGRGTAIQAGSIFTHHIRLFWFTQGTEVKNRLPETPDGELCSGIWTRDRKISKMQTRSPLSILQNVCYPEPVENLGEGRINQTFGIKRYAHYI